MNNIVFTIASLVFLQISIFTYSQDFPTKGEVYDYDVGDVFHYHQGAQWGGSGAWGGMGATVISEVIYKEYFENNNTVKYKFFKRSLIGSSEHPEPYIDERIDSVIYYNLDVTLNGDTVFENDNIYNGRKTSIHVYESGYIYYLNHFTLGCGRSFNHSEDNYPHEWSEFEETLVYFKKGDEEWGQEQIIVGLNEIETLDRLLVFPNPVSDNLNIKNANPSSKENKIKIFNSIGKLVIYEEVSSTNMQVNVRGLPNGLYFINQIDESGQVGAGSKFVKVN